MLRRGQPQKPAANTDQVARWIFSHFFFQLKPYNNFWNQTPDFSMFWSKWVTGIILFKTYFLRLLKFDIKNIILPKHTVLSTKYRISLVDPEPSHCVQRGAERWGSFRWQSAKEIYVTKSGSRERSKLSLKPTSRVMRGDPRDIRGKESIVWDDKRYGEQRKKGWNPVWN